METNVPVYINNLKEMQELEEEQLKELGSANAPTVYFTTAIQKSEEPALAPDNVAISTSSGSSSFQKNPVAQKHFQNVKNLLSNYISTQTTTAPKALVQNPIDKVFAGKLIVFSLKVTSNQANGTNDVAASYQKEADDLSQNEKTKELLEQIILENYAKDHGKNVDDLTDAEKKDAINQFNNMTDEEKIDLINQYVEDHVDYEWEENNELSDMDALVSQLLGGGNVEGDCEEIAILKAALLEAAGIDAELGFTSSDGKTIDHVVVIVGETILNTTGADSVTLDDILIKTSHDKNGNVTVTSKGTYELNTHEGSDEPTIGSTDVANIFGEYGTTVKNPDGTTVLIYGNSETSSKANAAQYVEDYKKAAAEAKETGKPVVIEVTGSLGAKNGVVVLPDGSTKFFGASGYNSGLDRAKWFAHNWNYENGNHDYLSDLKTEGVGEAESPGKAVEILQKAGTEKTESFDPLDCFFFTESGFMQLDPDRIYDYMRTIMIIANLMRIFAMLNSWEAETRGLIHEEDTGQKSDYESFGEEVVNRWVQGTMTAVNLQVQQLIQNVSSYNSEHFKELTGEIKDAHDDFEDALYDVISSGGNQREYWKEMGQVSGEYLDAVEGMADSMNAMSQAQSNASKAAKRKDGDMDALLNTATKELASQLKDIVKRSDEGKSKVSGLDIFMGVLCGLLGLGALFASFFVPGLLVLAVPLLTQFGLGIKDAVDKSNNDDCYLKPDMTKIDRLRDSFVRLQIVQRELIMFHGWDSDTRNLVHQEMTGIGGRRSRKETVSKIYEEKLNFDSLMFETTLNLNMQTIQVHNMKRYCELQYDKVASFGYRLIATLSAGFRLAGMVLALVAAALAIAAKFIPGPIGAILEGISALCSFASMVSTFCADALQDAAVEYADSAVDDAIHYEKSKFQPKDDDPIFAEPENDIITYYFGDGS
ncbi:MAG: transglutaminase-like domain-containing protein [Candidatus Saganbacteria bacterium]|nr:transglutaminase-like domain-containing protein [Candidatus Saganbacteria bacterium]